MKPEGSAQVRIQNESSKATDGRVSTKPLRTQKGEDQRKHIITRLQYEDMCLV